MLFPGQKTSGRLSDRMCPPLLSHVLSWHWSPYRPRRPQGGICTFTMSFSQAANGRGMGGTVVPCVFAELLVSSHAGVMLVHHSALLTGVGRVHPFLVPPLAEGSYPFM